MNETRFWLLLLRLLKCCFLFLIYLLNFNVDNVHNPSYVYLFKLDKGTYKEHIIKESFLFETMIKVGLSVN